MNTKHFVRLQDALQSLETDPAAMILEGECGFRAGDETRRVMTGDLIFIPRDTVHGPIIDKGRIALLSIFAPFFDREQRNIRWSRDGCA